MEQELVFPNNVAKYSRQGTNRNTLSQQYINNLNMTRKIKLTKNERQEFFIKIKKEEGYEKNRSVKKIETFCEQKLRSKINKERVVAMPYIFELEKEGFGRMEIFKALKILLLKNVITKDKQFLYWKS